MKSPREAVQAIPKILVAVLVGSLFQTALAQQPFFPDLVFHPEDKERNDYIDDTFSRQLRALKEAPLRKTPRGDGSATTYRFLWLGSNEHPTCVRVTRAGSSATLHVSRHDQHPGLLTDQDRPKLIIDREVKLIPRQWESIVGRLEAARFWDAPTEIVKNEGIADGDLLVIEGMRLGKYHVVVRHRLITKKDYEPIFGSVLEAAGTDVSESWHDINKRSFVREFFEKERRK